MKGLILINAYSQNEDYLYQPHRLKEEFEKLGVDIDIIRNNLFLCYIDNNQLKIKLSGYDFCVFFDKDKYILKALSMTSIPLFNSCEAILNCDDKMLTYLALAGQGVPIPKTLPGLLCYSPTEKVEENTYQIIEEEIAYPLIVKESYGSLGKGVYLAHDRDELKIILEEVKCKPHLCQQFIATSYGKDVRVMVVGGKVIGGMLRSSSKDFRSNLGAGGEGEPFNPSGEMVELAIKVAEVLGLEYCGIDFLFGSNGEVVVCEVNSNAFFHGFELSTKINVAKIYAEHIITKVNG